MFFSESGQRSEHLWSFQRAEIEGEVRRNRNHTSPVFGLTCVRESSAIFRLSENFNGPFTASLTCWHQVCRLAVLRPFYGIAGCSAFRSMPGGMRKEKSVWRRCTCIKLCQTVKPSSDIDNWLALKWSSEHGLPPLVSVIA